MSEDWPTGGMLPKLMTIHRGVTPTVQVTFSMGFTVDCDSGDTPEETVERVITQIQEYLKDKYAVTVRNDQPLGIYL